MRHSDSLCSSADRPSYPPPPKSLQFTARLVAGTRLYPPGAALCGRRSPFACPSKGAALCGLPVFSHGIFGKPRADFRKKC